jgi:hypothetical protein
MACKALHNLVTVVFIENPLHVTLHNRASIRLLKSLTSSTYKTRTIPFIYKSLTRLAFCQVSTRIMRFSLYSCLSWRMRGSSVVCSDRSSGRWVLDKKWVSFLKLRLLKLTIQFNSIRLNSIQFNSIQFNSIQLSSIIYLFTSRFNNSENKKRENKGRRISTTTTIIQTPWGQNPKVDHHIYKSLPTVPIMSQLYPLYTPPASLPKIHSDTILPYTPWSSKLSLSFRFSPVKCVPHVPPTSFSFIWFA